MALPDSIRRIVADRAEHRCEYCRIQQAGVPFSHEVDHFVARKHGGLDVLENLVWACMPCNRRKGSDLTAVDVKTGAIVALFNPREQRWAEHFEIVDGQIVGLTAIGRATARLLQFNTPVRIAARRDLVAKDIYP